MSVACRMSRRKYELAHNRSIVGLDKRRRSDYLPNVRVERTGPPENVYATGPKAGQKITKPAEKIRKSLYLFGSNIADLSENEIDQFRKRFKQWLSEPKNRKIVDSIEGELLRRQEGVSRESVKRIAAAIADYWIRESAALVRQGKEPSWILSILGEDSQLLTSKGGRILDCVDLRVKGDTLDTADRKRIIDQAIARASGRISQATSGDDAYDLVALFHPSLRKYRFRR